MSAWETFPSFEPAFEKCEVARVPFYLTLLGPSEHAGLAVKEVSACVRRSGGNFVQELTGLLAHPNWRLHLVAAVAILVSETPVEHVGVLWKAIHRPSWVSPQLAAAAWRLDPNFILRAHTLIAGRCAADLGDVAKMDWVERHTALGPSSFDGHSAKLMAALVALVASSGGATWLDTLLEEPDIRKMLASDVDRGGQIATHWIEEIARLIPA